MISRAEFWYEGPTFQLPIEVTGQGSIRAEIYYGLELLAKATTEIRNSVNANHRPATALTVNLFMNDELYTPESSFLDGVLTCEIPTSISWQGGKFRSELLYLVITAIGEIEWASVESLFDTIMQPHSKMSLCSLGVYFVRENFSPTCAC
jgi:hypothetical protein